MCNELGFIPAIRTGALKDFLPAHPKEAHFPPVLWRGASTAIIFFTQGYNHTDLIILVNIVFNVYNSHFIIQKHDTLNNNNFLVSNSD